MLNIGFFGNFEKVFEDLIDSYNIEFVIFEYNKENKNIQEQCLKRDIPLYYIEKQSEIYDVIKVFVHIDFFIVASFGLIFDENILRYPKLNTINFHPGILPQYRGRHPLPQAILNKDLCMGMTSHVMNLMIDKGDILNIIKIPIDYEKSYIENEKRLMDTLKGFTRESIDNYLHKSYIKAQGVESYYKPLDARILQKIFNIKQLKDLSFEDSY